jgi:hypothetical protein
MLVGPRRWYHQVINTHLDGRCLDTIIQPSQAQEILRDLVQEAQEKNLPLMLLGALYWKADGTETQT